MLQRAKQNRSRFSFIWSEVSVPRTHGKTIGFAHSRDANHLNIHIHVTNHTLDDVKLLRILLPEKGKVRINDVEQLHHDRGDAFKMGWPRSTFEPFTHLPDLHGGPEVRGIHLIL